MGGLFQKSQNFKSYLYLKAFNRGFNQRMQKQRFRAFVMTAQYRIKKALAKRCTALLKILAAHKKRHYVTHLKYIRLSSGITRKVGAHILNRVAKIQKEFKVQKERWVCLATVLRFRRNISQMQNFIVHKKVMTKQLLIMIESYMYFQRYMIFDYGLKSLKTVFIQIRERKKV